MSSKQSSIATLLMAFGIFFCSSDLIRIEAKRSLQLEMNPGCVMDFCRNISVAYIRSFNSDSIVSERNASSSNASSSCYHFLWIFTRKYTPTIFLFESDPNARLMIDWKKFDRSRFNNITSNFIDFIDGEIQQSFGLELSQLFVRNMTTKQLIQTIPIDGLGWRSNIIKTNRSIWIKFIGDDPRIASISFELEATKLINEIDQHLPRLTLSESSNLVRLTLENININEKLENPIDHLQVCANFTTVLGGDAISNQLIVERTIDDEFTPGVFQDYRFEMRTKNLMNQTRSSFISWKPIAYYDHSYELSKSLKVLPPSIDTDERYRLRSIGSALNGYFFNRKYYLVRMSNLSFNSIDDEDFNLDNSTSIEFSFTINLKPLDSKTFSTTITIFLICLTIIFTITMILFVINFFQIIFRKLFCSNYNNLSNIGDATI